MTKRIVRNQLSTNKNQTREDIKRIWGDVPVSDARKDLRLFIRDCDVTSASRKDPGNCIFAQACKRQFAAEKVLFYLTTAFVQLPQEDGTSLVERFCISSGMREMLENFDKGHAVKNLAGFVLKAPMPSQTLAGASLRNRKNAASKRRTKQRSASIVGSVNSRTSGPQGKPRVIDLDVRNGTGMVHFIKRLSKKVNHKADAHAD